MLGRTAGPDSTLESECLVLVFDVASLAVVALSLKEFLVGFAPPLLRRVFLADELPSLWTSVFCSFCPFGVATGFGKRAGRAGGGMSFWEEGVARAAMGGFHDWDCWDCWDCWDEVPFG